jgi:hypothetical protein
MCSHEWKKVNDVQVCIRCGLTRMPDGRMLFDRKLPNYKSKKVKNNANKK